MARVPVLLAASLFALAAGPLRAQTTADIRGTVVDAQGGPLPGATVEVASDAMQGARTAVTDAAGAFRFPLVPPGSYRLTARLDGFGREEFQGVRIGLGETATIPVTLSPAVSAEVSVKGEVPLVDTVNARIGTSLPGATLMQLPLGRNFSSAVLTLPGTGTDVGGNTVYGATGLESSYIVEGLDTTNTWFGYQGKQLNLEFVQEVEVRTGGYEAEYGKAMGASVNVLTKSGGNEYHGSLFGYYDSGSFAASDQHVADREALNQALPVVPRRRDAGLDLGGYFFKDFLWFFGAYDKVAEDTDYRRVASLDYTPTGVISNYVSGTDRTRSDVFSGKLTLRGGASHTITASVFGDPSTFEGRIQSIPGPDSAVLGEYRSGGTDVAIRWDGVFGTRLLGQAQYGYHEDETSLYSDYPDLPRIADIRPYKGKDYTQTIPGSGLGGSLGPGYGRRNAWSGSLTAFLGRHEVKGGASYEYLNSSGANIWSGGGAIIRRRDAAGNFLYALHRAFAKVPLNCQVRTDGSRGNFGWVDPLTCNGWESTGSAWFPLVSKNVGLFLQDSWKPLTNLTVNAGVRYEDQRMNDAGGSARVKLTGQWSPRVGVVWDPLADGRAKAFATYGRYYQVIPQALQIAMADQYTIFAYNYVEDHLDLVNDSALFPYQYIQGSDYVPPDLKGMYQDEISAGVEVEIWRNWSVGLKGIYRSIGRALEDRCDVFDPRTGLAGSIPPEYATTCLMMNPGEGAYGQFPDPQDPGCWEDDPAATVARPCESTHASRIFRGLQLDVRRRFSERFQLQASYLYSKLTGNYDGFVKQMYGQASPAQTSDFDSLESVINGYGRLMLDRTHQARLTGTYAFGFGPHLGVNATFATGAPLSILGWGGVLSPRKYLEPRGSWDELPSTYQVDLHAEWPVRIGPATLTPVVDVFNVTDVQPATARGQIYNNLAHGNQDPPCTNPTAASFGRDTAWQSPRLVRLGLRASF